MGAVRVGHDGWVSPPPSPDVPQVRRATYAELDPVTAYRILALRERVFVVEQDCVYADLDGRAVWLRAVDPFLNREDLAQVIVAINPDDRELFERRYRPAVAFLGITVVDGGAERADSIAKALAAVGPGIDHIAVHDAARPCVTVELVDALFAAAIRQIEDCSATSICARPSGSGSASKALLTTVSPRSISCRRSHLFAHAPGKP